MAPSASRSRLGWCRGRIPSAFCTTRSVICGDLGHEGRRGSNLPFSISASLNSQLPPCQVGAWSALQRCRPRNKVIMLEGLRAVGIELAAFAQHVFLGQIRPSIDGGAGGWRAQALFRPSPRAALLPRSACRHLPSRTEQGRFRVAGGRLGLERSDFTSTVLGACTISPAATATRLASSSCTSLAVDSQPAPA